MSHQNSTNPISVDEQIDKFQLKIKQNRIAYLKEQFISEYYKGIKKGKYIAIDGDDIKSLLSRIDSKLLKTFNKDVLNDNSDNSDTTTNSVDNFIDPAFYAFKLYSGTPFSDLKKPCHELIFNFLLENDPTPNKEYLQWFIERYKSIIKQRKVFQDKLARSTKHLESKYIQDGSFTDMLLGGKENRFFEDTFKIKFALEKYDFLKKTKTFKEADKDINKFNTYDGLIKLVKPFMSAEEGSDDVDTLDHKELLAIENQVQYEKDPKSVNETEPRASLCFQNDEWIVVHTHNIASNKIFGKYTTWCTSGTLYGHMFDTYNKDGHLFVFIKKGFGSRKQINNDPTVRIQLHFESQQLMDATDSPVVMADFFNANPDIKNYFKNYVVNKVLRKLKDYKTQVERLVKFGYTDDLIDIYKDVMPEEIDLTGFEIDEEKMLKIGEITSLKVLKLANCNITTIPDNLSNLVNLEELNINMNPKIKYLPKCMSNFSKLKRLYMTNCDLQDDIDVSGMTNLVKLHLDYNLNLSKMPKGVENLSKLECLTIANCNILEIDDSITKSSNLMMLDVHYNKNLIKIPFDILRMPKLFALCVNDTKISDSDISEINSRSIKNCIIIKY